MDGDMLSNKKLNPVVTELFIRGSKLNISLVFITQYYFAVPKNIRLTQHTYSLLVIGTTPASDNSLRFRKKLLKTL